MVQFLCFIRSGNVFTGVRGDSSVVVKSRREVHFLNRITASSEKRDEKKKKKDLQTTACERKTGPTFPNMISRSLNIPPDRNVPSQINVITYWPTAILGKG